MDQSSRNTMTEALTFRKRRKAILILRERQRDITGQKMKTAQHIY